MIHRLALARPVSTVIGAATLVVLGGFSLLRLPVALLPSIERPAIEILARAGDRSRDEVLHGLTEPIERRLGGLPGIVSLESETEDGACRIRLLADWNVDADRLRIDVGRRVEGAGRFVPEELEIRVEGGDASPIVEVAVTGGGTPEARTALADKVVVPELARLSGAGRFEVLGRAPLRAVVRPRAADLAARDLTAADVADRLRRVGESTAAGRLSDGAAERPLVVRHAVRSLEDLRAVLVPGREGAVPLGDVADVTLAREHDGTSFRVDDQEGVLVRAWRAPGANAVAVARRLRERVAELDARAPGGLRVAVVSDRSGEVVGALRQLGLAALLGITLGTVVLRFMLGRWAPTLALGAVVPASFLAAFTAFQAWGVALDVVSLAGLALAAGMLVDNSVVVLEAIETSRRRGDADPRVTGTGQVALPVVAACATTVVVFVPLLYLKGLARAFFGEQAFAIVTALSASLLFSLTMTPVLAGRGAAGHQRSPGRAAYLRVLDGALRHPLVTVAAALLVTAAALGALARLPRELFPEPESRALVVSYRLADDLADAAAERLARQVEDVVAVTVRPHGPVRRLAARGLVPAGDRSAAEPRSLGRIEVSFSDAASARRARLGLVESLSRVPDATCRVAARPGALVESVVGRGQGLEVVVSASTEERVGALAARVAHRLRDDTGLVAEVQGLDRPRTALVLLWDDARLARLRVDRGAAEEQVRVALGRVRLGRVEIPGVEPEVLLEPTLPASLPSVPVSVGAGAAGAGPSRGPRVVPLSALARTEHLVRTGRVHRVEGRPARRLQVRADGADRVSRDPVALAAGLGDVAADADERVELAGEGLEIARSFSQLRFALALSLLLAFLAMAAAYESLLLPLLIMSTVPIAAGGGLGLLALTGQSLNIMSFLGLILLGGLVVNNSIVLVHRIEQHRASGLASLEAVRAAAGERYRPIVMTTATTLLGMLPLALLAGEGVELRRALALTVSGGLATSTLASLLLVPVLHRLASSQREPTPPAPGGAA